MICLVAGNYEGKVDPSTPPASVFNGNCFIVAISMMLKLMGEIALYAVIYNKGTASKISYQLESNNGLGSGMIIRKLFSNEIGENSKTNGGEH